MFEPHILLKNMFHPLKNVNSLPTMVWVCSRWIYKEILQATPPKLRGGQKMYKEKQKYRVQK